MLVGLTKSFFIVYVMGKKKPIVFQNVFSLHHFTKFFIVKKFLTEVFFTALMF